MLKSIKFITAVIFLSYSSIYSQNPYSRWYFGFKSAVVFNKTQVEVLEDSKMDVDEGCASISDSSGNLLFYTDGINIWNSDHVLMKNGNNLFGHFSSVQSAIILKRPGNGQIYYVFTSDKVPIFKPYKDSGICVSIVDMALDNGRGEVVKKNVKLVDGSVEHLTATMHSNNKDYWVATLKRGTDSVILFLLTENGLSNPIIYKNKDKIVGELSGASGIGQMKFSNDRTILAYVNPGIPKNTIHLLKFDPSSGLLTDNEDIINLPNKPYGIEFSPNSKYLYISFYQNTGLFQINLDSVDAGKDFWKICTLISKPISNKSFGSLQLAPDNKIYLAKYKSLDLGVINNPDEDGVSCNFELEGLNLKGRLSGYGLPFFVSNKHPFQIILKNEFFCIGDSIRFEISGLHKFDSIVWELNNVKIGSNKLLRLYFLDTGIYNINATVFMSKERKLQVSKAFHFYNINKPDLGVDKPLCLKDSLKGYFAETYLWSNGQKSPFIEVFNPGVYWLKVKYKNCLQSDTINFEICDDVDFFIPDAFSPNNDGNNDYFKITGKNIRNVHLSIFNIWGEKLFCDNNEAVAWDGTYKLEPCQQGCYFYTFEITGFNGKRTYRSGVVTLIN